MNGETKAPEEAPQPTTEAPAPEQPPAEEAPAPEPLKEEKPEKSKSPEKGKSSSESKNLRKRSRSSMSRKSSGSGTNSESSSESQKKKKKRTSSESSGTTSQSKSEKKRRRKRRRSSSDSRSASSSSISSNRGKTIYVSNLRRDLTERYLEKKFDKFGNIKGIEIVMDPFTRESRGFGFITYETSKEAQLAIDKMHRKELKRRVLTVEMSRRGKPRVKTPGRYMGRLGGYYYNENCCVQFYVVYEYIWLLIWVFHHYFLQLCL